MVVKPIMQNLYNSNCVNDHEANDDNDHDDLDADNDEDDCADDDDGFYCDCGVGSLDHKCVWGLNHYVGC